ncbi:hypothetical protein QBC45DRAFT_78769 [Copromyces sp. CBS 386.78]|nr:hypothetical protein QBC45DRAFT_78769 [Copromyces sp. CBS 386.78]
MVTMIQLLRLACVQSIPSTPIRKIQSFWRTAMPCNATKSTQIRFQWANLPYPYPLTPSQANTPDEINNSRTENTRTNSNMKI